MSEHTEAISGPWLVRVAHNAYGGTTYKPFTHSHTAIALERDDYFEPDATLVLDEDGYVQPDGADIDPIYIATARLISAAPEMFAVLEAIVRASDGRMWSGNLILDENSPLMGAARDALANATGDQS